MSEAQGSLLIQNARLQSSGHRLWLECLIFLFLFLLSSLLQNLLIATSRHMLPFVLSLAGSGSADIPHARSNAYFFILLFSSAVFIAIPLLYCRVAERRTFASMGFHRHHIAREYALGFLTGALMFAAAVFLNFLFGAARWAENTIPCSFPILGIYLTGYIVQGMSEEVLCRGYFMISAARRSSAAAAVLANSLVFALLHIQNNGIALLPLMNLTLFGLFISLWVLWRGSIWSAAALHTAWNFVQGNIFGIRVSGLPVTDSVRQVSLEETKGFINGGDFGLEGGVCVTAVLLYALLSMLILLRVQKKHGRKI